MTISIFTAERLDSYKKTPQVLEQRAAKAQGGSLAVRCEICPDSTSVPQTVAARNLDSEFIILKYLSIIFQPEDN
jgi:hypothetical protein